MSVQDDVLNAVIDLAQATGPYAAIQIGAVPTDNGICMSRQGDGPTSRDMAKGASWEMDITCNAKHTSQQAAIEAIDTIHEALVQALSYPATEAYQITNIETTSGATLLERQANDWYLYGSSLRVKFYYRRATNA